MRFSDFAPGIGALVGGGAGSLVGMPAQGAAIGMGLGQSVFSAAQAREQMEFQERMSSTAFQRRSADLLAAGINPILAATQGPAGVPGGAMGVAGSMDLSSARAQDAMLQNQASKSKADAFTAWQEADRATVDTQSAVQLFRERNKRDYFEHAADADAEEARQEAKFQREAGQTSRYLGRVIAPGVSSAVGLRRAVEDRAVPSGFPRGRGLR